MFIFAGLNLPAQQLLDHSEDMKRQTLTASPPTSQPPLDLRTAVQRAVDNNHSIQKAKALIEQHGYDKNAKRAVLFPSLNFEGSEAEQKDSVSSSGSAAFGGSAYNQYAAALKLSQPLFAFGSLAAIEAANYDTKLSQIDLEIAVRDLTVNVIQYFYKVLVNQRLVELLERQLSVVNESLSTAQKRLHTGRGQLLDVLQVKTEIALLKPQIEDAHNQLESAGAQLATYMAEEGKYELKLKGALKGLTLKDLQKRLNLKGARLPELERVRLLREQLSETRQVVMGKHLPNVALNGEYGSKSYTKGELFSGDARYWSVMLKLTVPLFSGFQSLDERRSLVEQDRQFEYQGRDTENTLALNQVQSLKTLQSTGASLVSAEEAAQLATQAMNEARRNYRLSTIDFLQFLTVEKSALQADSSLDQTKLNNIVAISKYLVATGQPLSILVDTLQENVK